MGTSTGPAHLLLLDKPLADDLIDGGLCQRRRNGFAIAVAVAIVRDRRAIAEDISVELVERSGELPGSIASLVIDLQPQILYQMCRVLGHEDNAQEECNSTRSSFVPGKPPAW